MGLPGHGRGLRMFSFAMKTGDDGCDQAMHKEIGGRRSGRRQGRDSRASAGQRIEVEERQIAWGVHLHDAVDAAPVEPPRRRRRATNAQSGRPSRYADALEIGPLEDSDRATSHGFVTTRADSRV